MTIQFSDTTRSIQLRKSLSRGMARQACAKADKSAPPIPKLFAEFETMRPNRKSAERVAARLLRQSGVVRAAIPAGQNNCLGVVFREAPVIAMHFDGQAIFDETGILYTRIFVWARDGGTGYRFQRVAFSFHAIKRLIERSACSLGDALLPCIDREAEKLLIRGARYDPEKLDDVIYLPSKNTDGVWVTEPGQSPLSDDWPVQPIGKSPVSVPTLSIRTFLSPDEMSPIIYLAWKRDTTMADSGSD